MGRVITPVGALAQQNIDLTLDKIVTPKLLLAELLYPESTARLLSKESVTWGEITKNYSVAPFTKINGSAVNISRNPVTLTAAAVTTPYIGIKLPLNMLEEFGLKEFGDNSGRYVPFGQEDRTYAQRMMQRLTEDLTELKMSVDYRKEWMAAQTFLGSISYSSTEETGADFTIDLAKPPGNTITPSAYLDDSDSKAAIDELRSTIRNINKLQGVRKGPTLTDAICGGDVADQLYAMKLANAFDKLLDVNYRYDQDVNVSIRPEFEYAGTYEFLFRLDGVNFWSYTQQLTVEGSPVDLIRPKYIEFIGRGVVTENRTFYGANTSPKFRMANNTIGKQWSFTWEEETAENKTWEQYLITRPLMVPRQPSWYYSYIALA